MSDWYLINIAISGTKEKIDAFVEDHFHGMDLKDQSLHIQIDDLDIVSLRDGTSAVDISAQHARSDGEDWVQKLRVMYPDLKIAASTQTWEEI